MDRKRKAAPGVLLKASKRGTFYTSSKLTRHYDSNGLRYPERDGDRDTINDNGAGMNEFDSRTFKLDKLASKHQDAIMTEIHRFARMQEFEKEPCSNWFNGDKLSAILKFYFIDVLADTIYQYYYEYSFWTETSVGCHTLEVVALGFCREVHKDDELGTVVCSCTEPRVVETDCHDGTIDSVFRYDCHVFVVHTLPPASAILRGLYPVATYTTSTRTIYIDFLTLDLDLHRVNRLSHFMANLWWTMGACYEGEEHIEPCWPFPLTLFTSEELVDWVGGV